MLRHAASALQSFSSPRLCQRISCPSVLERRFSDLAANATPISRQSSLGGILSREFFSDSATRECSGAIGSSNRGASPSANERPPRQKRWQDKQASLDTPPSARPVRRSYQPSASSDKKASEQLSWDVGNAEIKAQRPAVESAENSKADEEDASTQKSPRGQPLDILPKATLAELFSLRAPSARHTKGRGGDYSGYLPPTVSSSLRNQGPIERAQLALGRNKQVTFKVQNQVLDIVRQTVGGQATAKGGDSLTHSRHSY